MSDLIKPAVAFVNADPADAGLDPALPSLLEESFEEQVKQGLTKGMQIFVARANNVVTDLALGTYTQSPSPITQETRFFIGSASKPIAATAVHILVDRGLVTYTDPVARLIPGFEQNGKAAITIAQLLTHTAGIPDPGYVQIPAATYLDREAAIKALCEMTPDYAPGTQTMYHGISGWFLLQEIVDRLDGRGFERFCIEEIFEPLGMTRTTWGLPAELEEETTAYSGSDEETDSEISFWRMRLSRDQVIAAANAHSSAGDLARFYLMWRNAGAAPNQRLIGPAVARNAVRPHVPWGPGVAQAFGYGFWVGSDPRLMSSRGSLGSPRILGHPGHWCSTAWFDPDTDVIFVALSNVGPGQEESDRRFCIMSDLVHRSVTQ
ncbi:MAG TPA: serine hydrolase domain-containing protein [Actinomycetota bacterium]|nr:serine hydrolase domain-containing protein [Actinomycetota bacterium]